MTREETEKHLDWLYRLRSEIYVFMPKDWLIPMNNALDEAIGALNQQKEGHWRPIYQGDEIIGYRCSECEFGRTGSIYRANYCHNCGADMREGE